MVKEKGDKKKKDKGGKKGKEGGEDKEDKKGKKGKKGKDAKDSKSKESVDKVDKKGKKGKKGKSAKEAKLIEFGLEGGSAEETDELDIKDAKSAESLGKGGKKKKKKKGAKGAKSSESLDLSDEESAEKSDEKEEIKAEKETSKTSVKKLDSRRSSYDDSPEDIYLKVPPLKQRQSGSHTGGSSTTVVEFKEEPEIRCFGNDQIFVNYKTASNDYRRDVASLNSSEEQEFRAYRQKIKGFQETYGLNISEPANFCEIGSDCCCCNIQQRGSSRSGLGNRWGSQENCEEWVSPTGNVTRCCFIPNQANLQTTPSRMYPSWQDSPRPGQGGGITGMLKSASNTLVNFLSEKKSNENLTPTHSYHRGGWVDKSDCPCCCNCPLKVTDSQSTLDLQRYAPQRRANEESRSGKYKDAVSLDSVEMRTMGAQRQQGQQVGGQGRYDRKHQDQCHQQCQAKCVARCNSQCQCVCQSQRGVRRTHSGNLAQGRPRCVCLDNDGGCMQLPSTILLRYLKMVFVCVLIVGIVYFLFRSCTFECKQGRLYLCNYFCGGTCSTKPPKLPKLPKVPKMKMK